MIDYIKFYPIHDNLSHSCVLATRIMSTYPSLLVDKGLVFACKEPLSHVLADFCDMKWWIQRETLQGGDSGFEWGEGMELIMRAYDLDEALLIVAVKDV